jgi:hypothetical protein
MRRAIQFDKNSSGISDQQDNNHQQTVVAEISPSQRIGMTAIINLMAEHNMCCHKQLYLHMLLTGFGYLSDIIRSKIVFFNNYS